MSDKTPSVLSESITISALDLATTPFALERAQQQVDTTKDSDTPLTSFLDTPLTSFLENYQPYPGFLRTSLPFLHRALQTYETRALKPFIHTAAQSQSILIQIMQDDGNLDGVLSRRRVVPIEVQYNELFWKIWQKISVMPCNQHRSLEALDLATRDSVAVFRFDRDYEKLWKFSHFHLHRPLRKFRRWWKIILPVSGLIPFALLTLYVFLFPDFKTLDRGLCGVVESGSYPCTITPNPDVAGIGGRSALYMQIFLLGVLLSFSPKEATPATWTLVSTSTALALSGLIAMATSKLTLYHVTLTAKMQGLPIVILTIIEIFPPRERGPYIYLLQLFRFTVTLAVLTWSTVKAPCFGSQPECNAYVFTHDIFSSEMAIASVPRMFSLLFVVITFTLRLLGLVLFPDGITIAFQSLFSRGAERKWYGLPASPLERKTPAKWGTLLFWAVASFFDDNSRPPIVKLKTRSAQTPVSLPYPVTATTNLSPPSWLNKLQILYQTASLNIRNALHYPKVWRLGIAFAIGAVLMNRIEATISSNRVSDEENVWTYGQVLAVILTIIPVVHVLQLVGLAPSPRERMKKVGHKEKVL